MKIINTKNKNKAVLKNKKGFTLIELLVVITIIAVLASIAFPVFQQITGRGDRTKAIAHAKQVVQACWLFATDYNQRFPSAAIATSTDYSFSRSGTDANGVLGCLIPNYCGNEKIFSIPNCDFADSAGITGPDNDVSASAQILEAGENHWTYVEGLRLGTSAVYPMVFDGSTAGSGGSPVYSTNPLERGGRWEGQVAIVAFSDSSCESIRLSSGYTIPDYQGNADGFGGSGQWSAVTDRILAPL